MTHYNMESVTGRNSSQKQKFGRKIVIFTNFDSFCAIFPQKRA